MTHFLDINKTDASALRDIIDSAISMKQARAGAPKGTADADQPLDGRMVALIFEKPSTRTRVSFDVGVRQMGGQTMVLSGADMQLGHGETIADTARVMSRYVDLIMIRTFEEATLLEMAEHATVPVINGLTDEYHPCQLLADLQAYSEHRGDIEGRSVAWIGDGNNVCNTFIEAAAMLNFELRVACPRGLEPMDSLLKANVDRVRVSQDPVEAVTGADLVVTDVWASMGQESESGVRIEQLAPYQVDAELMSRANADAVFMHCLPAHRGEEVTAEVIDGERSLVWPEAENRLHAQKALLEFLLLN